MDYLILDVETTISNKGNPFDQTNKLVCVGLRLNGYNIIEYYPDTESIKKIQYQIDNRVLVGFNAKFDLHWLRKIGIDISKIRVWDCQIAEYILNNQKTPYPSLDQAAEKYGFNKKLDVVKLEYWDKGIDTDEIPREILSDYLNQDLILTEQLYLKQLELFQTDKRYPLFKLQCADLLVLEEMEWNGIYFNTEKAMVKAKELEKQQDEIYQELIATVGNIPFNINSNDHVSAILYGGSIFVDNRIPVGVYKSGIKIGQIRYKVVTSEFTLPRLCEPLKGTEVKKPEGSPTVWKTNEDVLRTLKLSKEAKKIVGLISKYSELEKLRGTYLEGWTNLIDKMHWPKNMIHGNLNQCVAITGRLSSSKPNLQNADPITKVFMESRYG